MSRLGENTTEFGEEECFEVKSNADWVMTGVGLACNVNMVPTLNPTSKYGPRLNSDDEKGKYRLTTTTNTEFILWKSGGENLGK